MHDASCRLPLSAVAALPAAACKQLPWHSGKACPSQVRRVCAMRTIRPAGQTCIHYTACARAASQQTNWLQHTADRGAVFVLACNLQLHVCSYTYHVIIQHVHTQHHMARCNGRRCGNGACMHAAMALARLNTACGVGGDAACKPPTPCPIVTCRCCAPSRLSLRGCSRDRGYWRAIRWQVVTAGGLPRGERRPASRQQQCMAMCTHMRAERPMAWHDTRIANVSPPVTLDCRPQPWHACMHGA